MLHVTLELDADADPIHGSLTDDCSSQVFDGWVELVRLIENALERARAGTAHLGPSKEH